MIATLAGLDGWTQFDATDTALTDAQRVDLLTALERVKSAAAAAQARVTDAFARSQRARLVAAGADARDARRSVAAQVALARRDAPRLGGRHVGLAATLVHEMPGVLEALERGETSERRAVLIARETAHLSREQRAQIDAHIADRLAGWGDARTEREARRWALRLDPDGAAARAAKAAADRRVTIRPAPDAMTYLTALLPVREGVAVYGALHRAAVAANCDPADHRTRGQVMADELVGRTLAPAAGAAAAPGVEIHLVMTDRTLLDGDHEPADLVGHGPIPAPLARDLARADARTRVFVRRLYTDPGTGDLSGTDPRRRLFPDVARAFLTARDQICRTPFCGAPIRHADHTVAVSRGGKTILPNGNGRCAACNQVKDTLHWASRTDRDGVIVTSTPTGQRHRSRPPDPPRSRAWSSGDLTPMERRLAVLPDIAWESAAA